MSSTASLGSRQLPIHVLTIWTAGVSTIIAVGTMMTSGMISFITITDIHHVLMFSQANEPSCLNGTNVKIGIGMTNSIRNASTGGSSCVHDASNACMIISRRLTPVNTRARVIHAFLELIDYVSIWSTIADEF
jgi:hypothetical protein